MTAPTRSRIRDLLFFINFEIAHGNQTNAEGMSRLTLSWLTLRRGGEDVVLGNLGTVP